MKKYKYDKLHHITEEGNLIYKDRYYLDPFWEEEYWIHCTRITNYFLINYGLTLPQVWNLCHGYKSDKVQLCSNPGCDEITSFHNLINGFNSYCCQGCSTSHMNKKNWQDPDYRSNQLDRLQYQWTDPEYRETVSNAASVNMSNLNTSYEFQALAHKGNFLSLGSPEDKCTLYIGVLDNYPEYYKFGITQMTDSDKIYLNRFRTYHVLHKSNRVRISDIEYELSLHFKGEWLKLKDLQNFIIKLKSLI